MTRRLRGVPLAVPALLGPALMAALVAVSVAVFVGAGTASAHDVLVGSDPPNAPCGPPGRGRSG